jgi:uncharacterized protein (TIGR03083 family)
MRVPEPILVGQLFAPIHEELLSLLRSLTAEEWLAPTAAGTWTVRDVAAHLLDTGLRRLSIQRDGYAPPLPPDAFANGLGTFVNGMNASGVSFAQRLSPALLIGLHEHSGGQFAQFMASLDPFADAQWSVSWAGEETSPMWFDVARELTERWHHQQQIRDAVGRPPLYEYLAPVIDTFVRALPYTYRDVNAPDGTTIVLHIDDGAWTLSREAGLWRLFADAAESPSTRVTITGDRAWRLFTKQQIDPQARIEGSAHYAEPLLRMLAIVA